ARRDDAGRRATSAPDEAGREGLPGRVEQEGSGVGDAPADDDEARVEDRADRGEALAEPPTDLGEECDRALIALAGQVGHVLARERVRVTAAALAQAGPLRRPGGHELARDPLQGRPGGMDLEAPVVAAPAPRA